MPQMSPLLWFNLYIYFILTLIMIIMLIYYLNLFYSMKILSNKMNYLLFKKMW